jgi:hypothetical protein
VLTSRAGIRDDRTTGARRTGAAIRNAVRVPIAALSMRSAKIRN